MGENKAPHTDEKDNQFKTLSERLNADLQASQTPIARVRPPIRQAMPPTIVEGGDIITGRVRALRGRLGMLFGRDDRGNSGGGARGNSGGGVRGNSH
jgi:hypothetical protein